MSSNFKMYHFPEFRAQQASIASAKESLSNEKNNVSEDNSLKMVIEDKHAAVAAKASPGQYSKDKDVEIINEAPAVDIKKSSEACVSGAEKCLAEKEKEDLSDSLKAIFLEDGNKL